MKGRILCAGMEGACGSTARLTSVASVTVIVVLPVLPPNVAEISDEPTSTAVARPVLSTVTAAVVADDQVAVAERSAVVWSVYVPVAVNFCVVPFGLLGVGGSS